MDDTEAQLSMLPTEDAQKKPQRSRRKRARRACLTCRSRKVRCDVSQRGSPCTNCYLDNECCVVTRRPSKYRRSLDAVKDCPEAAEEEMVDVEVYDVTAEPEKVKSSPHASPAVAEETGEFEFVDTCHNKDQDGTLDTPFELPPNLPWSLSAGRHLEGLKAFSTKANPPGTAPHHQPALEVVSDEVVYCRYPFLAISEIRNIPQQDVSFLELQGCLKVPTRPYLDEFVQHYFLHVHPLLPLLNEADFWEVYEHDSTRPPKNPIPLLLFQAMLFATSTHVSQSTVRALGYPDFRSMRAALFRRTKLLYDLETESSPVVISQASVLLSLASLPANGKPRTIWLSLAIENAKAAEAHLYSTMAPSKQRNILKRLWWCCIIRDRSMGLLLRRSINITREQFNLENDPLGARDLRDELQHSRVYSPSTKLKLAEVLSQSVQLFIKLTEVLMLIFPPGGMGAMQPQQDQSIIQLYECRSGLREWSSLTALRLPRDRKYADLAPLPKSDRSSGHVSITLYTNLMYMYYHAARIALCHHEVLHLDTFRGGMGTAYPLTKDLASSETQHELQSAILDMTECHNELHRLGLTQWLPQAAMGFSALPLVLNILDIKLTPPATEGGHESSIITQSRLNVLIEFMKAYWPRYEGVNWIGEIVRHIVGLTQLNGSNVRKHSNINWVHIFAFQPKSYLRLVLALDFGLSKGRIPQDADFPVELRGVFSLNLNPLKELVEGRWPSVENRNQALQTSRPSSLDVLFCDPAQLHPLGLGLGLDDCLINTLENGIDFDGFPEGLGNAESLDGSGVEFEAEVESEDVLDEETVDGLLDALICDTVS
ncbi:hypothetical protein ACJ41O_007445 [Fusarium nematophilum]